MTVSCLEDSSSRAVAILPRDSAIRTSLLSRLFSLASTRRRATRSKQYCSSCRFRISWNERVLVCSSFPFRLCPSAVDVVVAGNEVELGEVRQEDVAGKEEQRPRRL